MKPTSHPTDRHPLVGIEWARALDRDISEHLDQIRCVELIPENFFSGQRRHFLEAVRDHDVPVLVHAVELSIGSDEPLKAEHLDQVLRVMDQVPTVNLSDHLCFTEAGGVEIGQLTPLPFTVRAADVVCRKIEQIQARIQVPFLIENIANRFEIPRPRGTDGPRPRGTDGPRPRGTDGPRPRGTDGPRPDDLGETGFINRILQRTGCALLLDLHNLHANALNFGFDPFAWLARIDIARVAGIHLAGGVFDEDGTLVDSHSRPVPPRVWDLYRWVVDRVVPEHTIVERTDDDPDFANILDEIACASDILAGARVPGPEARASQEARVAR